MRRIGFVCVFCLLLFPSIASSLSADTKPSSILFGRRSVAGSVSGNRPGVARAFLFRSRRGGMVSSINVYLAHRSHARTVLVGLYSNAHGMPRLRLASGSIASARAGRWNSARVHRVAVTSGTTYWLVVLGRGGPVYFAHARAGSCARRTSYEKRLISLPRTWRGGTRDLMCPLSAYVAGTRATTNTNAPIQTVPSTNPGSGGPTGTVTATHVGYDGAPTPTCNYVVAAGADPSSVLASASPGQTVCLANGTWSSGITITGNLTQPSPGVTLAAQHPGKAIVDQPNTSGAAINMGGTVDNLTVEGLDTAGGFSLWGPGNNDTFIYNTMENWQGDQDNSAIFSDAQSGSDTNISFEYNQIDHAPQCLQIDDSGSPSHWIFSHNVCGPGIGNGNNGTHYMQAECVDGITVDNNAFEGALASGVVGSGQHVNILHWCGNGLQFENNIMWDTQSAAQSVLLGDDGPMTNDAIENNLDVQDPTGCSSACTADTYSVGSESGSAAGSIADNNTSWNSNRNIAEVSGSSGGLFAAGSNTAGVVTAKNNIMATYGGNGDYSFSSGATTTGNVSADSSGNIAHWSPCWQNQNWPGTNVTESFDGGTGGPNDGSPWVPPPSNYYKPVTSGGCANKGVASSEGYQTTLGP